MRSSSTRAPRSTRSWRRFDATWFVERRGYAESLDVAANIFKMRAR
jgi:hypothetical protein